MLQLYLFFFPTHPLLRFSPPWMAGFTCPALGRLCPPSPNGKSMGFLLSQEIIHLRGLCDNPCEIKHLIWCGVEQTMDQTSIEISKLK